MRVLQRAIYVTMHHAQSTWLMVDKALQLKLIIDGDFAIL